MRLIKLGVYHPTYLRNFYEERPEVGILPYSAQLATLLSDRFGSSDFWTMALRKLGYETAEIIANAEALQTAWANEQDINIDRAGWLFEIAAAQIKQFRPDVLLVADYSTFTAEFLRNVRRENPSIRLVLGWCGAPYFDSSVFGEWDVALSCVPELVAEFNAGGLRSVHVDHAFDPRILEELEGTNQPTSNFTFVGSIVKRSRFHLEREKLLHHLVNHTDLQIWSDVEPRESTNGDHASGGSSVYKKFTRAFSFAKRIKESRSPASDDIVSAEIVGAARPPVFGLEMFRQFQNSRVVFNNHIDISLRSASNMRLFEATGVGTCLITDHKENLSKLFEPGKEVLTYKSAEECVEKVNYILEHEDERRSIAVAGQARTLRGHTYELRSGRIDEVIRSFCPRVSL